MIEKHRFWPEDTPIGVKERHENWIRRLHLLSRIQFDVDIEILGCFQEGDILLLETEDAYGKYEVTSLESAGYLYKVTAKGVN